MLGTDTQQIVTRKQLMEIIQREKLMRQFTRHEKKNMLRVGMGNNKTKLRFFRCANSL